MKLDAYARETHHAEHIVPVWRALPASMRGSFFMPPSVADELAPLHIEHVEARNIDKGDTPVLVSASGAMQEARRRGRKNIAIMEHGAGQSFGGDPISFSGQVALNNSSYAGGANRFASLFLHPGPHPAARDAARYPKARVEVVGCPKLDVLPHREPDGIPTIAFSFHWDTFLSPETRSTFIYYREQLAEYVRRSSKSGVRFIGHGHPRLYDRIAPWYEKHGIMPVKYFTDVCRMADVYACDGMSTLYEFAATGRPVVVLNAPFYREEVEHGLRFWSAACVGENVWESYDLGAACNRALASPDETLKKREYALDLVYAYRSGAAERAAAVLESWADGLG